MKRRWEYMNKDEIIRRNLDILNEFMKYAFEFPDTLDKIPENAELVILPQNDPEMYRENAKLIDKLKKEGKSFVVVRMKRPEMIPAPEIEVMAE